MKDITKKFKTEKNKQINKQTQLTKLYKEGLKCLYVKEPEFKDWPSKKTRASVVLQWSLPQF